MKSRWSWLLLFLSLIGCTINLPDAGKVYPRGVDAAVLNQTTILSSSDSLIFESQFSLLDLAGYFDIGGVQQQDFTFTSPGHYTILDFRQTYPTGDPQAAVVVLEDESGDYNALDPYNFRSKMINKFCQDIQPPGSFVAGGFSRQGSINAPLEFSSADFTTDWKSLQDFIFTLSQRTGGKSSLYDALSQAINKLNLESAPNKNIIVLAHAGDNGSTAILSQVIDSAVSGHMKIHVLFLGKSEDLGVIPQLSSLTGGMLAILPTDSVTRKPEELITVFNHLYRLMCGKKWVYKLKVSYRPESGTLSGDVTHTLKVVNYIDGKDYNPIVIYTRIP